MAKRSSSYSTSLVDYPVRCISWFSDWWLSPLGGSGIFVFSQLPLQAATGCFCLVPPICVAYFHYFAAQMLRVSLNDSSWGGRLNWKYWSTGFSSHNRHNFAVIANRKFSIRMRHCEIIQNHRHNLAQSGQACEPARKSACFRYASRCGLMKLSVVHW